MHCCRVTFPERDAIYSKVFAKYGCMTNVYALPG